MDRLKKRFAMLVIPVALISFGSFLLAQGRPIHVQKRASRSMRRRCRTVTAIRRAWPMPVQQF